MKIIAPVKNIHDVGTLISAGAEELFGGVYDSQWEETFGSAIEYNRRGSYGLNANIRNWKELAEILQICSERNVMFSLTMNALRFSRKQYPYLVSIMQKYQEIGGRHVIVSDYAMFRLATDAQLIVTISSCANCFSQETVMFYESQGCHSVIFPRNMTISEMKEIKHRLPHISFEAFGMYSGCRFNDGNCLGTHHTAYRELCHFCDTGDWQFERLNHVPLNSNEQQWLTGLQNDFSALHQSACGQCAIFALLPVVDRIKILERCGSVERLEKAIRMTKKNIQIALKCESQEEYLKKMYHPVEITCGTDCYYALNQEEI